MQKFNSFKTLLESSAKIFITTHVKPDADALGSSLGLAIYLKKKGHEVLVVSPSDYPGFLNWMNGNDEVLIYEPNSKAIIDAYIENADLLFCMDFSSLNRINELGEVVRKSKAPKVLIDHHLDPEDFAEFNLWSTDAAATSELVFELIDDLGDKNLIDQSIAECLYAGIMTDTGSFRHSNTTQNVHMIVAELIKLGADVSKVAKLIYDTNTVDRIRFLGFVLSERLTILPQYKTAYMAIRNSDLKRFKSKTGDTEGFVNYALSIKGIKFAAVIIDIGEVVKMSFRSTDNFSVNDFARDHFEGGGHRNAAGGKTGIGLKETVNKFLEVLPEYQEQLNPEIKQYSNEQ